MSAVLQRPMSPAAGLAHVWQSWRKLTRSEAAAFGLAALLFGLVELSSLIELKTQVSLWGTVLLVFIANLIGCATLALCWLPAMHSDPLHPHRRWRLLAATLLGAGLAVGAAVLATRALPWYTTCDLYQMSKGQPSCHDFYWTDWLGNALWISMPALLVAALRETAQQRRRQELASHALLLEHGKLKRQALAARLATLQAQVEPSLLFQALVGIQQAYAERHPEAGERIERLIRHLRIALPRLQERSVTVSHEIDLVQSYLDVIRDLQGQAPRLEVAVQQPHLPMPAMCLLPLVQRALRQGPPERCWLRQTGSRLQLGFDRPGLCEEDAELIALRERLAVLDVRLRCTGDAGSTEFDLELNA